MHERCNCHFSNLIEGEELFCALVEAACRSALTVQPEALLFDSTYSNELTSGIVLITIKYHYSFSNFIVGS